jgi:hypothetical protein
MSCKACRQALFGFFLDLIEKEGKLGNHLHPEWKETKPKSFILAGRSPNRYTRPSQIIG